MEWSDHHSAIQEGRPQEHFQLPSNNPFKQHLQTFHQSHHELIDQHARQESTKRTSGVRKRFSFCRGSGWLRKGLRLGRDPERHRCAYGARGRASLRQRSTTHLQVHQILHQTPQRLQMIQTAKGNTTRWYQFSQNVHCILGKEKKKMRAREKDENRCAKNKKAA